MSEAIKFTNEELTEIKELQNLYNTVVYQAGQYYLEETALNKRKELVDSNLNEIKRKEEEIISSLTTKYGEGSINLESGEFMPVS